jgi:hypothetical protein
MSQALSVSESSFTWLAAHNNSPIDSPDDPFLQRAPFCVVKLAVQCVSHSHRLLPPKIERNRVFANAIILFWTICQIYL